MCWHKLFVDLSLWGKGEENEIRIQLWIILQTLHDLTYVSKIRGGWGAWISSIQTKSLVWIRFVNMFFAAQATTKKKNIGKLNSKKNVLPIWTKWRHKTTNELTDRCAAVKSDYLTRWHEAEVFKSQPKDMEDGIVPRTNSTKPYMSHVSAIWCYYIKHIASHAYS